MFYDCKLKLTLFYLAIYKLYNNLRKGLSFNFCQKTWEKKRIVDANQLEEIQSYQFVAKCHELKWKVLTRKWADHYRKGYETKDAENSGKKSSSICM